MAKKLAKSHKAFKVIPNHSSPAASFLRVRAVQLLISECLCHAIWKPFSSKGLGQKCADATQVFEIMSTMYARVLPKEASAWRNLTYRGLDTIFASSEPDPGVVESAVDHVTILLEPLVQTEETAKFREDLGRIFGNAVDVWND